MIMANSYPTPTRGIIVKSFLFWLLSPYIAIITVALTVVVTTVKFTVSYCQYPCYCTRVLLPSNYCRENSAKVQKVPNKSSLPQSSKKCLKYVFRKMRGNSRLFWSGSTLLSLSLTVHAQILTRLYFLS